MALLSHWEIGKIVVRYEQDKRDRVIYGAEALIHLSRMLSKKPDRVFSRSVVYIMRPSDTSNFPDSVWKIQTVDRIPVASGVFVSFCPQADLSGNLHTGWEADVGSACFYSESVRSTPSRLINVLSERTYRPVLLPPQ